MLFQQFPTLVTPQPHLGLLVNDGRKAFVNVLHDPVHIRVFVARYSGHINTPELQAESESLADAVQCQTDV